MEQVLTTFRQYLGERMRIDVEYVDEIKLVRTGKHVASVSRLNIDFQRAAPTLVASNGTRS
jgi:phenylacetate-CoA ligase